jgi:hypothetical protein
MRFDEKSQIQTGGLRYATKPAGTIFAGADGRSMSCFLCGTHQPRPLLESFKVAGRTQYKCRPDCTKSAG